MTRETVKKLLPIFKAYARGETIQIRYDDGDWVDLEDLEGVDGAQYRIKPEPPFACAEESYHEIL